MPFNPILKVPTLPRGINKVLLVFWFLFITPNYETVYHRIVLSQGGGRLDGPRDREVLRTVTATAVGLKL